MKTKKWIYLNKGYDAEEIKRISSKFNIPPLIATILMNRNIVTDNDIQLFLNSNLDQLRDPFMLKGMSEAIDRILDAVENNEKITVYGDYDVDGITSSAILTDFLRELGAEVDYYIPDRIDEGYGINVAAIDKIVENGTKLIITVDCGITAIEEVKHAKEKGVDFVITDHHQCNGEFDFACAVVNPNRPDCDYPFKELAGVGVVYKLIMAICASIGVDTKVVSDKYLDLVALGTIADVVRLIDENRIIVNNGIEKIKNTKNIGLQQILIASGLDFDKPLTAGAVGFIVAPRINAAGRIGNPSKAVELFLTENEDEAREIANMLNEENQIRRETEQAILFEALRIIEEKKDYKDKKVIVVATDHWHHGVVGIVASRITEIYNKPCILISIEDGVGKGSGRSIKGFNLFKALENANEHLVRYGGHELAAGLTIEESCVDAFDEDINKYAQSVLTDDDMIPYVNVDCVLPAKYICEATADRISMLEPFGMGNSSPIFSLSGLRVGYITALKEDKHIRMSLQKDGYKLDAFGFNMGDLKKEIKVGDTVDVLFNININVYRGERNVQLMLKDLRLSK